MHKESDLQNLTHKPYQTPLQLASVMMPWREPDHLSTPSCSNYEVLR